MQWLDADEFFRANGRLEMVGTGFRADYPPKCFVNATDFEYECLERTTGENTPEQTLLMVIKRDRECSQYRDWVQGFTPKEHREMIDAERLRQWQAKREDADREWRERQRILDLASRDDEHRWREAQDARSRRTKLIEILLSAGLTILSITIAAFFVIKAANIQADAQLRATKIQIDAAKAPLPPSPRINE
jgi:hypothetical protein